MDTSLPPADAPEAPDGPDAPGVAADSARPPEAPRMGHVAAIDGIRALAVVPVLLYHALVPAFSGGFLGVDVFFGISGYLITALILDELGRSGSIDLRRFWVRRLRRLLPAMLAVIAVSCVVALWFAPDSRVGLRGNVFGAVFYFQNWYQIFAEQSYFEVIGRGPLLKHMWSLSVEGQFYLVWPLVMLGLHRLRWSPRLSAGLIAAVGLASAIGMRLAYSAAADDPTKVFIRSDLRASGLLFGAAAAFVWRPWTWPARPPGDRGPSRVPPFALDLLGMVALVGLLQLFTTANDFDPFVYSWGFGLTGLLTVVLIGTAVHPETIWYRWLGVAPLRYLGERSYGIYLWHWPIFQLTRPVSDIGITGSANLAVRLLLTLGVAELSYRHIEMPIRRHGLAGITGPVRAWWGARRAPAAASALEEAAGTEAATGTEAGPELLPAAAAAAPPGSPAPPRLGWRPVAALGSIAVALSVVVATLFVVDLSATDSNASVPTCPGRPAATAKMVGSVLTSQTSAELGTALPTLAIDARPERTFADTVARVEAYAAADNLPDVLIVEYRDEGGLGAASFRLADYERLLTAVDEVDHVVLVPTNVSAALLRRNSREHPNVTVYDWGEDIVPHPEWIGPDGSLLPEGRAAFAEGVRATLESTAGPTWDEPVPPREVASELDCATTGLPAALGVGDSVMDRSRSALAERMPDLLVSASGGRRFAQAIDVVREFAERDALPDVVLLHLGTAGAYTEDQIDEMMTLLADVDHVVLFTVRAPKSWEAVVNRRVRDADGDYPNLTILDWHELGITHEDWFVDDRVHLNAEGAREYARIIDETIAGLEGPNWQRHASW